MRAAAIQFSAAPSSGVRDLPCPFPGSPRRSGSAEAPPDKVTPATFHGARQSSFAEDKSEPILYAQSQVSQADLILYAQSRVSQAKRSSFETPVSNQLFESQAKPSQAKPSQAKPSQAKPSQAKPSQAKPSQAKPSQAKPSQAFILNKDLAPSGRNFFGLVYTASPVSPAQPLCRRRDSFCAAKSGFSGTSRFFSVFSGKIGLQTGFRCYTAHNGGQKWASQAKNKNRGDPEKKDAPRSRMNRVCFGEMFPRRVSDNKLREIPRKGANHGLQETPDGREILREEVLRRRLPHGHD